MDTEPTTKDPEGVKSHWKVLYHYVRKGNVMRQNELKWYFLDSYTVDDIKVYASRNNMSILSVIRVTEEEYTF